MDALLVEVTEEPRGTQATAAAAAGDTTIAVEDISEFSDEGGVLDVLGVQYGYSGFVADDPVLDPDSGDTRSSGTLALIDPLTAQVDEDDPVLVVVGGQVATDAYGRVDMPNGDADGGDTPSIPIDYTQRAVFPVGTYDPPLPVTVADDMTAITAVSGVRPTLDGGMIDPTTLPDTSQPVVPPASTPDLTVTGGPDFFVLRVANTDAVWASATIEYHVSTDPAFTPTVGDPATLVGASRGVMVTNTLPDGTPYALDGQYYFAAIATNAAGSAPPTPTTSGQLDPSAVENIVAAQIVAGYILTGRVQFGQGYIDANEGLVLPQPDGTITRFPVDGVTPSTISGFLIANGMAVNDGAFFYGLSQITGTMLLNVGVPNPTKKPDVTYAWPQITPAATMRYGLAATGDNTGLVSLNIDNGDLTYVVVDKTTGAVKHTNTIETATTFTPSGGLCRIGGNYYTLGQDTAQGKAWICRVYDGTVIESGGVPTLVNTVTIVGSGSLGNFPNGLTIGTDGTGIIIAWVDTGKNLRANTRNTDGTNVVQQVNIALGNAYRLAGVIRGPYGLNNADIMFIVPQTRTKAWAIGTGNWTEVQARDFTLAAQSGNTGFTYDGSNLRTLAGGAVATYSNITTDTAFRAGYTWYDGDPGGTGTHETAQSPQYSGTWPARAYATVTVSPPPHADVVDTSQGDAAKLTRVYATFGTDAGYLQGTLSGGDTPLTLATVDTTGTPPPTASNFASSNVAPGHLSSEAQDAAGKALVDLVGNGSWRLGTQLAGNTAGALVGPADGGPLWKVAEVTSTSTANIADSTFTIVQNWAQTYENTYAVQFASGRGTLTYGGTYQINASVCFSSAAGGRRVVAIFVNGNEKRRVDLPGAAFPMSLQVTSLVRAAAGDVVDVRVWQNTGAALALKDVPGHTLQLLRTSPI